MVTHLTFVRDAIATVSPATTPQPIVLLVDRAVITLCLIRISAQQSAIMAGFLLDLSVHSARHHAEHVYRR